MKFRSIPPDPQKFPRHKLLLPWAIPALVMLSAWMMERAGHTFSPHGEGVLILFGLVISVLVALATSVATLASALPALYRHPSLRSRANSACVCLSLLLVVATVACIGYAIVQIAASP